MRAGTVDDRLPGYRLQPTLEAVQRFRNAWGRHHKPDDVNQLLRLFRKVDLQEGFQLDYLSLGRGQASRIWPYARPLRGPKAQALPEALQRVPPDQLVSQAPGGALRQVEAETLYRYLSYERSPLGLAEYAFFIPELWSLKSQQWAEDWLSLQPLVVRHAFDSVLRKAGSRLVRVSRPDHYDPIVQQDEGGGRVLFMAYQPGPWRKVVWIELTVEAAGPVSWQAKDVVASLRRR